MFVLNRKESESILSLQIIINDILLQMTITAIGKGIYVIRP